MKRVASIILSVIMLFLSVGFVFAETVDKKTSATSIPPSEWAAKTVETAKSLGIVNYGGNYNYPAEITRSRFCELIYNYYGIAEKGEKITEAENKFTDTEDLHIAVLNALGIIKGKSESEFCPNDFLTREEAATIFLRLIEATEPDFTANALYFKFADKEEISDWAMDNVQTIFNMGIMNGVGDGKFAPKERLTTEQAAVMLVRTFNAFKEWRIRFDYSNGLNGANHEYGENFEAGGIDYAACKITKENDDFKFTGENLEHISWLEIGYSDYRGGLYVGFSMTAQHLLGDEKFSELCMDMVTEQYDGTVSDKTADYANEHASFSVNSIPFKIKEVGMERGNNHRDFYFVFDNDISKEDICEIDFCINSANDNTGETEIAFSNLTFADKLNAQMPTDKNYMFSPLSIKTALALAANGAEGATKAEILNACGIESLDEFNALAKELTERYSQSDVLRLSVANSLWINKDETTQSFSTNFKETAENFYNADVNSIAEKNAVKEINLWAAEKTNGKILQVIDNAENFWAMLINAVYFKGAWQAEFSEGATAPDEFKNADGTKAQIDFMNRTAWFNYAQTKSAKIIELPYKNRVDKISAEGEYLGSEVFEDIDVSMYLINPEENVNPETELKAALNGGSFENRYVKLSFPKFKIEYSERLNDMLKNIGLKTAFDANKAQFEKMFDYGNMWFTDVMHKTYITVDEKGTEAAALTAIGMGGSSRPPEPLELKFNKPFYFAVSDNVSGEILFMGRYAYAER